MKKSKRKRSAWSIFFRPIKIICSIFLIFMVLGVAAGGVVYFKYQDEIMACKEKADTIIAQTRKDDFSKPMDTRIYGVDGAVIGTINSGHYEYVSISEISENLQNAYIAQEDKRFKEHHGVDYISLIRAGLVLVKNKGKITQGGSTITQQVIKNTYLTQERSFERKITELFAAPQMEKIYSKDEIMEFYCNTNFYANRCYGVAEASRYYFDKEAKDLTVWEAATLAGISNNPSRYNPVANPDNALKKRNQVIANMEKCGMITNSESRFAKAQPITVAKVYEEGTRENYQTSYAIYCASLELMKNDGFEFQYTFKDQESYTAYKAMYQEAYQEKSDMIRNGGFEIYTSLDSRLQAMLQETVDQHLADFTDLQENGKFALQGAAVAIDNKTGYVTAIVGGRGTDDEFNRGYLSRRQPGSTIKPLIDYGPAFETGFYYPSRLVDDHLFDKGPKNSSNRYYGEISVRDALNRSLNTVAWQVLADIGVNYGLGYLDKMHFNGLSYLDQDNTSLSLGGFTEGATVVDMARGYSVLANEGVYSSRTCITSILGQYDGELYRGDRPDERIFTADTAYMLTDILKGTLSKSYGTGYGLGLDIPAAGKTGTTNSNKDTWFCGYTRHYTTAIWVGYDTPKAMPGIYGKTYSGKMWQDFMTKCNEGLPAEDWTMPSTVSLRNVDYNGEPVNHETGKTDLFSSVLEDRAKADKKKWDETQKEKKEQAANLRRQMEAAAAASQVADQAAAELQRLIAELSGLSYTDSSTQEKISQATALLESFAGNENYEAWKQQLAGAISHAEGLPDQEEWNRKHPQEIGPGVTPWSPSGPTSGTIEENGPGIESFESPEEPGGYQPEGPGGYPEEENEGGPGGPG